MSERRSQEERRGEAERKLVRAAAELVGEIGPARVTLANVGERAGYSRGLATHHFGSKGALLLRVVEAVTQQFREAMIGESGEPLDDLRRLIRVYFEVMSDLQPVNRARLVLWADAVAYPSEDIRPAMVAADREFRAEIEKRLERAVAAGEVAPVSAHGLAAVIVAMLRGVALQSLIDEHVDLAAARAEIEEMVTARLTKENRK
ncbi:TetR/AcrR family transcriptional regulator [Mycobacterium vicinigordonae]|uniref:TetR/AcrR family transcriptional regulator n=1 Tax=Mycobacterium vicinigordonae TaxID=1719132 RepID=A0A7D6E5D3_9MYCO|nr:TetR/AcrR family transcriptional regulator [Mycobacterium vicinigordonae]QLL05705.1 TetR/AcrR family transcriptional regulator [Mycobacterium vicinigordonae]